MLEIFRFVQRFRVPLGDIDMLRHANNVAYVRWLETARCEYFAEVIDESIDGARGLVQAKLEITYERQIRYREPIAVGCRISRMGTKSFDFAYEVWSEADGQRCAHAIAPMVAYDHAAGHSIDIPRQWHERIAVFEPLAAIPGLRTA